MMHRFLKRTAAVATAIALFAVAIPVRAQTLGPVDLGMFEIGHVLKLTDKDPRVIAARLVNASLELIGIVALVMILISGFGFLFSMGQKEKMAKASATFRNAIIGLIIVLSSWAIVRTVIDQLVKATAPSDEASSVLHAITSLV
ncbi:MAG TPA: hypothetical protein VN397_01480 [Candidatus Methylomirabilis sp.]|nr:hypothetical protein [Candidatus Methylomirabilis sp.]